MNAQDELDGDRKSSLAEADRKMEITGDRRPYERPRLEIHDASASILGPITFGTPDGASGSFRP